jgi:hypothetical protein
MEEQFKELNKNLSDSLKKLLDLNKNLLKDLTEEQQKAVLPIQNDINAALKAAKDGNILALNEIQNKYASTNIQ